ncbi:hypothetical protein [Zunongwangia sp. H14]|uniref:HYC_CC_PP family protein n=1 Tax=Zunongwangia sp. H14 TaxID=3240792 RepID=UPI003563A11D
MKTKALHTVSFLLAVLVIFSTFSFTVDKHFCGNTLVGKGVFSSAKKCKTEMHSCGVEVNSHNTTKKDSCCSNEKENIDGQDELKTSSFSFDLLSQTFIIPVLFISGNILQELERQAIPHKFYKPPLLASDVQVMYQVFLI